VKREETAPLGTCGRKPRPQDGSKSARGHHCIVSAITCVLIALAVSALHSGKPSHSTDSRNSLQSMYRVLQKRLYNDIPKVAVWRELNDG
jgi:hypothetical protein